MKMGLKIELVLGLFFLVVIAAYAGLSEAVTCENVGNCTPDISKLQGGGSQDDIKEACASIKSAMQCFRDAMADCRTNSNIPEDTLTKLESRMDSYDQMLSGYCGSDGSNQQEIHCLRWSSGPDQQRVLRACAETTLSLPWGAIVNEGESIDTVRWFYSGRSNETIATYTFGNVSATPTYFGRAHMTTNAGIDIDHVTALESGNYSVEVVVLDSNGSFLTLSTFVIVSIEDGLQTTDGKLHVVQNPLAEYNHQTGQYHVALRCGTFTYPSNPPFSAIWQTPYNQTVPSSSYQAGSFQLLLPNPVEGGSYVCSVPPALACVHCGSGQAVLTLDTTEARLAVLEAQQRHLEAWNGELEHENSLMKVSQSSLQTEVTTLQTEVTTLQTEVNTLQTENNDLNTKVSTLQTENTGLNTSVNTLQTENNDLNTKVNTLQTGVNTLQTKNNDLNTKVNTLQTGVNTLQTESNVLNTKVSTLQKSVSTLQTGVNTLQTESNGLNTKVSIFQTGVNTLQTENYGLKTKVNTLQTGVNTLQTENSGLKTKVNTFQTEVNTLQTKHNDLNTKVNTFQTKVNTLQTDNSNLKVQTSSLQDSVEGLRSKRVSFHAEFPLSLAGGFDFSSNYIPVSEGDVIFPVVINNEGNGYSAASGRFTAPFAGTYYFVATASVGKDQRVRFRLKTASQSVGRLSVAPLNYGGYHYGMGSVSRVIHLNAGQQVWLEAYHDSFIWSAGTMFGGFLISADP